jgi:hypothetical protein
MLTRVIIFTFVAFAAGVVLAMSHSFRTTASGRLHNPIMFEFYHDSTTRAKTDVESFGVSVRTPDHRWKAIWSIDGGHRLAQPIQYGVAPDGFAARIVPQKLLSGHTYLAFASARGSGLSSMYFRFQKDGAIIFPDSPD